jgi:hypothetical protein
MVQNATTGRVVTPSRTIRVAVVLLGLCVVASLGHAQRRVRRGRALRVERPSAGARIGYDFDRDHAFIGGQMNLPVGRRWQLVPSAELYPGETGSPYRLNADLKYRPATAYGLFYFGAGFAFLHAAGTGRAGANGFAGWEGRRARPFKPFAEAKLVFASATSFNVEGGLNFTF